MRIVIASEGKDENAEVCSVTGRAPYFLIFEDGKLTKVIKNPFAVGSGGAGFGVAQMLGNEKVDVVVSGKFGPKVIGAFEEKGIKIVEMNDKTVKEALEEVNNV
jgi:predicted Fe-Mo cluster-binding NifX family protein